MQALSIKTDFPSNQGVVDFSILPSPSTFFLSSLNNFQTQSPTYDQYPHSATDYHSHFKQEEQIEQEYSILPSLSSQESSVNGRSPSPASSFPSTPSGSPIPGHLQIESVAIKGEHEMLSMHNKMDPTVGAVSFESLNSFYSTEIPSQQHYFNCASAQHEEEQQFTLPPPHRNHYQHYQVNSQYAPVYGQQSSGGGGGGFPVNSAPSQMGYVQQPQFAPPAPAPQQQYSTASYGLPHPAPPPAAIETPHGTYYFVPNVNVVPSVAPTPVMATVEPIQLPTPPPHNAVVSPMNIPTPSPSPPQSQAGYVKLSNGLTAGVAIAQATSARRSASGATATVVVGGQKLRLPVGQGKRGSTKRPAKKDQVKRFICPHPGCGRAFARNFNMQSHHKSHLGIREFNCPHCPKKFSRRHDRARHCSAVHDSHVDRDGNIAGTSMSSGSPSASVNDEEFDDYNDDGRDKNYLVDYAD